MIRKLDWVFFVLSGYLLWQVFYLHTHNHLSPDGAVIGLMARHILEGELPVFFYGYGYIGSLKSFIAAGLFLIFGATQWALLLLPPLFYIGFVWTTYWFGTLLGGQKSGRIAMLLTIVTSHWLILFSAEIVGGYIDTLFYGNLLLIFLHKFCQADPWNQGRWSLTIGFVGGLAFWQFPLSVYYLATVLFCLFLLRPGNLFSRHLFYVGGGFYIGSFPFWLYNWNHDFVSLGMVSAASAGEFLNHAISFFNHYLGAILGWGFFGENFFIQVGWSGIMVLFFISLAWLGKEIRWHGRDPRAPILFLFLAVVIFFCRSNYVGARSPMVVAPLLLIFPIALALFLREVSRHTKIFFWGLLALVVSLYAIETRATLLGRAQNASLFREVQVRFAETLNRHKVTRLYAPFYISAPLAFSTQESILATDLFEELFPRHPEEVGAAAQPGFLLPKNWADTFEKSLIHLGTSFKKEEVENHFLYFDLLPERRLGREISTEGWKGPAEAFDRDILTRWTPGTPQKPGQSFELELPQVIRLTGLELRSLNPRDLPVKLKIEVSVDGKSWQEMVKETHSTYPLYHSGTHPFLDVEQGRMEMAISPTPARHLRLTQLGKKALNFWSIHELYLYEEGAQEIPKALARKQLEELGLAADSVAEQLSKMEPRPIYTDSWHSARLALRADAAKINFLPIYNPRRKLNDLFPQKERLRRYLNLEDLPIFVVEKQQEEGLERSAARAGIKIKKKPFGPFTLYETEPQPEAPTPLQPISRDRWLASANPLPEKARKAIDDKLDTVWRSRESQKPGMFFQLDLGEVEELREIRLDVGKERWEYPHGFEIQASTNGENWQPVPVEKAGVLFWDGKRIVNSLLENKILKIRIPQTQCRYLKIALTEEEPAQQWSLADIKLYR